MRLLTGYLALAVLTTFTPSCSKSSSQLLKAGDAKVCTQTDVTSQVLLIVKQQATPPQNDLQIANYEKLAEKALVSMILNLDTITSKEVDQPNQKVACTATLHLKNESDEEKATASVDYLVTADLSADKPIVTVDTSGSTPAVNRVLSLSLQPHFAEARKKLVDADAVERNAWISSNAAILQAREQEMASVYAPGTFKPDELRLISQIDVLREDCNSHSRAGVYGSPPCKWEESATNEAHAKELCNPSDSEWVRCGQPAKWATKTSPDAFSLQDRVMMAKADNLNDKCRGGTGGWETESACKARDAFIPKLHDVNICWGPDIAIEAEKMWIKCVS